MNDVFLDDIVRSGEPDPGRRGTRRDGRKERDRRRRSRRRRSIAALLITLVVVAGAGFGVWKYVLPAMGALQTSAAAPEDYAGPAHGSVEVTIPAGATRHQDGAAPAGAGRRPHDEGVQRRRSPPTPPRPGSSRAPTGCCWRCPLPTRSTALLNPANRVQTKVTIPEGFRARAGRPERLASVAAIPVDTINEAMKDTAATGPAGRGRWELRGLAVPGHLHLRARHDAGRDDQGDGRQDHLGPRRAQGRARPIVSGCSSWRRWSSARRARRRTGPRSPGRS